MSSTKSSGRVMADIPWREALGVDARRFLAL